MRRDGHHIIHNRQEWSLRPEARFIRETPSLIIKTDRDLHDEIHRACPAVPLLGYRALMRVAREFEPTSDSLETLDSLTRSIEVASKHPKSHDIESKLALLAIDALELQRPYIEEAIYLDGRKYL